MRDHVDADVAHEILRPAPAFCGTLGPKRRGVGGLIRHIRSVHAALCEYCFIIEDLVAADIRAAARMTFTCIHRRAFFCNPATGKRINWAGGVLFNVAKGRIAALWVLGDIDGPNAQRGTGDRAKFTG